AGARARATRALFGHAPPTVTGQRPEASGVDRKLVRGVHLRNIAGVLGIVLCVTIAAAQTAKVGRGVGDAVSCRNIENYGGSTSSADNGPALMAALAGSAGVGHCVSFPPGRFTFASAITFRLPDGGAGRRAAASPLNSSARTTLSMYATCR
ncbi:MAG: hypothetical protein WAU56_13600, partial [Steroidobacteraceae bacterium]